MKYFFILGRNPVLSLAEVLSYLEKEGINSLKYSIKENGLLIDIEEKLDLKRIIRELGGTIAIGEVSAYGKREDILNFINKNEIYFGEEIKFDYSVINFADEVAFDEILQTIKDKFKAEKLRAFYRSSIGNIDLQESGFTKGTPTKIKSRDVVYFLYHGTEYLFGELKAVFDSNETEKRDINKPVRRAELAISPRLAKILINLSQVKKNETLLDPFCGIGTIIMEALLQNINTLGMDFDYTATNGANKNINWLKSNYQINNSYEIIKGDSREARVRFCDGIATEPSLGELLRITPTEEKAKSMILGFENLIIDVLNNLKSALRPGKRIAFTSPLIKTHHGQTGCSINNIMARTNLKMAQIRFARNIKFPIVELRKDSIVGREFFVLEK